MHELEIVEKMLWSWYGGPREKKGRKHGNLNWTLAHRQWNEVCLVGGTRIVSPQGALHLKSSNCVTPTKTNQLNISPLISNPNTQTKPAQFTKSLTCVNF